MKAIDIKRLAIILYTLGLCLLLGLAVWQLQRGFEKQSILAASAQTAPAAIQDKPVSWAPYLYQAVSLQGKWLPAREIVLENRIYKGRVGFEVLTPFQLASDDAVIMVNRGWVEQLSVLAASDADKINENQISGVIYQPEKGLVIGDAILPEAKNNDQWPKKSLYLDLAAFESILKLPLQTVVLVLDEQSPAAYQRLWKAVVITPAKHFGYAVQWLGLAITMLVYGVIWFRRKTPTI